MTIQDELEIRNLAAAYAITTDNADVDGFMACWVPAEDFGGYESGPFGSMKTWQELKDFESHHVGEGGMAKGKRHQVTNLMVEPISANKAYVTHDLVVLETAEIPSIIATGRYDKSLVVKTENGWKFKSRTLTVNKGFFKLMEQQKANQSNS